MWVGDGKGISADYTGFINSPQITQITQIKRA
jgi:hypothetical protein